MAWRLSNRSALLYVLFCVTALSSPVWIRPFLDRQSPYIGVPIQYGPFERYRKVAFDESGPIDVLIVGDSEVWVGLNSAMLEAAGTRVIGRPLVVRNIAYSFGGTDLAYEMLRDVLARRRVSLVITQWKPFCHHPIAHRWLATRDARPPPIRPSWRDRFDVYAETIFDVPKYLLAFTGEWTKETRIGAMAPHGGLIVEYGVDKSVFVPREMPRALASPHLIDLASTNAEVRAASGIRFDCEFCEPGTRELLGSFMRLATESGTRVLFVQPPTLGGARENEATCSFALPDDIDLSGGAALCVSGAALFQGIERPADFFYDRVHMNKNGNILYTRSVADAIARHVAQTR